ncbi:MAG: serine protease [bacterium]|nr:serine protease [bacterium]
MGKGTGFFVKHNGVPLIVTARHNVAFTQRFWVARFEGSREKTITVIHPNVRVLAWDRKNDLAVLEVENLHDGVDALELADTIPARNTELMAWGTPSIPTLSGEPLRMIPSKVGLHDVREEGTMDLWTEKITSQFGRAKWLYLDGKILPGNSGGPVLDTKTGRVVGVISMGAGGMNEGIAAPAEAVARLLKQIPTPSPLTNVKAEVAIGHLLEAFLPLSDPGPDVERFVAPRELGHLVGKRIGMLRQMAETTALCDMREQNSSSPNKNPWMEEACRFFQHVDENPKAKAALKDCVKDIPSCARSTLSSEIQKSFRTQFRYQQGKLFQEVKVIEEPVQDANPRLWHVKARWLIGDETATERLLLEEAQGEIFVRLFEEDGTPVVKVEEKPEPPAPKAKPKERPSGADPYNDEM